MTLPLLGIDIGTTHCKAALFDLDGCMLGFASREMSNQRRADGSAWFDPEEVWEITAGVTRQALFEAGVTRPAAVGIASMAESGLLVDPESGKALSVIMPWFDTAATSQVALLQAAGDPQERFLRAGIRPNFKCSLAKILWLRDQAGALPKGAVWLSAADFVAFRLTGRIGTDPSLAGRTYAFSLDRREWDAEWLGRFGLEASLFPPILWSGTPLGETLPGPGEKCGLAPATPAAVCGHDHVVAAYAAGAVEPGSVFNSMGTAEALIGALPHRPLGEQEFRSGLVYGPHVLPGKNYWMGGLSASGGSVEWLRSILGDPPLDYEQLQDLLEKAPAGPTGILYFPYLSGSGSPHTDVNVRGAFIGLGASHGRAELLKALLEGACYEVEFIRRAAQAGTGLTIDLLRVSGGSTRNPVWMQVKADVCGCRVEVPAMPEATLLGAALLAGVGAGIYPDHRAALRSLPQAEHQIYHPDPGRHRTYQVWYEHGYLSLQAPLRETASAIKGKE